MRRPIPDEVHRFVLTSVPSVPLLEAMLLLRAHPDMSWSGTALAQRLFVPPRLGDQLMTQLCDSGLAVRGEGEGTFRWNPGTAMAPTIDELAQVYASNVVGITELIHSRQDRRAIQFADAFLLRKKEN